MGGEAFWRLTPREFIDARDAAYAERHAALERDLSLAWHVAVFAGASFAGTLPPLDRVLARVRPVETTPIAQVNREALIALWSASMGIKAQPISEAARKALSLEKES